MGSLFSPPSVPTFSPVQLTPQASVNKPTPTESEPQTPNTETEIDEQEIVRDIVRRNFRGRNSLIQTSYRGVLNDESTSLAPQRKTLLGE